MKKLHSLVIVIATACVPGCSDIHSSQREAVEHIRYLGGDVKLTPEKKAKEVNLDSRPVVDADLKYLSQLDTLESLNLTGTGVSGGAMAHISNLTNLKKLSLGGGYQKPSNIDDEGLSHLTKLANLEQLVLSDSKITDAGLAHLSKLDNLRSLYVFQTKVGDAGLTHLEGLKNLEVLRAGRTGITDEAARAFQAKMPKLKKFIEEPVEFK